MSDDHRPNDIDFDEHDRMVVEKAIRDAARLCADRGHDDVPCDACAAETFKPRMGREEARAELEKLATARGLRAQNGSCA